MNKVSFLTVSQFKLSHLSITSGLTDCFGPSLKSVGGWPVLLSAPQLPSLLFLRQLPFWKKKEM